eukprot:jgi/Orpsp1_1/1174122/evm.model.c7180000049009.1
MKVMIQKLKFQMVLLMQKIPVLIVRKKLKILQTIMIMVMMIMMMILMTMKLNYHLEMKNQQKNQMMSQ